MSAFSNALIDIVALVMVVTVMISDRRSSMPTRDSRRIFRALLCLVAGVLLCDIPAWLLDGKVFPGAVALCYTLDTCYYLCQILFCYLWLLFSDYWNHRNEQGPIQWKWQYAVPLFAELLVILTNPFTGYIFTIGPDNVYTRGPFYLYNLFPYYLYIALSAVLSVRSYILTVEPEQKRQSLSFIIFMLLPICGVVLETLFYGISWTWPFTALSLLMVYLSVQQQLLSEQRIAVLRQSEEALRLQSELTDSRVAIMLSQMQPHFLYNALSSIKALCTRDPALAAQAAGDFAAFLRNNLDSLTDDKPVSFLQELEHTRRYLALELIRFQDRLRIAYDIRVHDFRIPTLTLQPIVENAVRYGTMQRIEGGTVRIATSETEETYLITVSDDGVGFDPSAQKNDGRSHIGISNVRSRLSSMCGGTLYIDSAPGRGTVAVIAIPKRSRVGGNVC